MNWVVAAFILGVGLGTLISQVFRWRDLTRIGKYIEENNRLLMSNMDMVEENQLLLEKFAKQQGIEWSSEENKP